MEKIITELEIHGKRYAYVVTKIGGEDRFFVMVQKKKRWEDYYTANGYGYKYMEAAAYAFDNRLFYAVHYEVNNDEACIIVSFDYLSQVQQFNRFESEFSIIPTCEKCY